MNVHILGFEWKLPPYLSLVALFQELKQRQGQEQEFGDYNRLIFVDEVTKYHIGLILTAKDYRHFCEMHREGSGFRINVHEVADGTNLIDFNFFVIHKLTGRGLYQYYHNSCHPNVFSRFCSRVVSSLREGGMNAAVSAAGGDDIDANAKRRIERQYRGRMEWQLLVRREAFEVLIRKFQHIGNFELDFGTIEPEQERLFGGLQGVWHRLRHRVSFRRSATLVERAKAIIDFVHDNSAISFAAVHGKDEDGLDATLRLARNPDSFAHYDFDEMARHMTVDPTTFKDSPLMKRLLKHATEEASMLGAETR